MELLIIPTLIIVISGEARYVYFLYKSTRKKVRALLMVSYFVNLSFILFALTMNKWYPPMELCLTVGTLLFLFFGILGWHHDGARSNTSFDFKWQILGSTGILLLLAIIDLTTGPQIFTKA